jgi:hypothetical protein
MESEVTEVVETPQTQAVSYKDVAARAAVAAIVGVAVTEVVTFLLRKAVRRFHKTAPITTIVTDEV